MKTKHFGILGAVLCAILVVGGAEASPRHHQPQHMQPHHVVHVNHVPRPVSHHCHDCHVHHVYHHDHHSNAGDIIIATAILLSALM